MSAGESPKAPPMTAEERDLFWYKIAGRYFEGLRSPEDLRAMFVSDGVVHGTIHEIWKRDPKVSALEEENARLLSALTEIVGMHFNEDIEEAKAIARAALRAKEASKANE